MLFCTGNLETVLDTPTGYPFMEVFYQAINSLLGSLTMCTIVIVNFSLSMVGMLAATSRQLWSFSRDKGVPGGWWWSLVS
jgi:amino acid transporter